MNNKNSLIYFSKHLSNSIAIYPIYFNDLFKILDKGEIQGKFRYILGEFEDSKWYTEKDNPEICTFNQFNSFCERFTNLLILDLEFTSQEFSLGIDDNTYVVVTFEERKDFIRFINRLFLSLKIESKELKYILLNDISEKFYYLDKNGKLNFFADYNELMQSD